MLQISETYCIDENHPSLVGHFPDAPIVPGVVLLDYARLLLQNWQPQIRIKAVSQAKFLQPLSPQQRFIITLTQISAQTIRFECLTETDKLIYGTFIVENQP